MWNLELWFGYIDGDGEITLDFKILIIYFLTRIFMRNDMSNL